MANVTVVVVTHNRAAVLRETLRALSQLSCDGLWEALVVDNASSDHTRTVVAAERRRFPAPLRYVFVGEPGKYQALNTVLRTISTPFIAATDDDAAPEPDWLHQALLGLERYRCDFVGGPVYPQWVAPRPAWLDPRTPLSQKVLGLQDHGDRALEYGAALGWPLGVNVAYRREVFDRVGVFNANLGRVAGTLRNQSQREWHLRGRAAGVRGMYLPRMVVHHRVDAARLTRRYFYRWFYWHGISRAILTHQCGVHLLEPEGDATHGDERHFVGVPISLWRDTALACVSAARRRAAGRAAAALEYELLACFSAGVLRQRLRDL